MVAGADLLLVEKNYGDAFEETERETVLGAWSGTTLGRRRADRLLGARGMATLAAPRGASADGDFSGEVDDN